MKRLFIVYNPRSSHYEQVKTDIIDRLKGLKGVMVGKFEVEPTNVDDNARRLAKVLTTGDLVIAAGGDGTANIAVNGIMLSKAQNVKFGVIGYGNFNDVARTFGNLKLDDILRGHVKRVYPLECKINGKHWRFGMCYFTLGMFAEACACFDAPKTRKTLRKGGRKTVFSLMTLVKWWLKNHRQQFLPETFQLGDSSEDFVECKKMSDYMAVNGARNAFGLWSKSGTITLGEAEPEDSPNYGTANATVSTESPLIQAYGVTNGIGITLEAGNFNFYDGKIVQNSTIGPAVQADHVSKATITNVEYLYQPETHTDEEEHTYFILEFMR